METGRAIQIRLGDEIMLPHQYSHLNDQKKGAVGEALARATFILVGFEVYKTEYDDRGIDFVTRKPGSRFYSVQVKASGPTVNPFIYASKFQLTDEFLFVAVRLVDGKEPAIYVARGSVWKSPAGCINYNPKGGAAGPYYEFRFNQANTAYLTSFLFAPYVKTLD
jgi:hypothetical protein